MTDRHYTAKKPKYLACLVLDSVGDTDRKIPETLPATKNRNVKPLSACNKMTYTYIQYVAFVLLIAQNISSCVTKS